MRVLFKVIVVGVVGACGAAALGQPGGAGKNEQAREPEFDPRPLMAEFERAMRAREFKRAVAAGERLEAALPGRQTPAYNLACACAQAGDPERAVRSLRAAADRGYAYVASTLRDQDLDPIRASAGFAEAMDVIRANNRKEVERLIATRFPQRVVETVLPPNLDRSKPAPLIVALHGSGGTAKEMVRVWSGVASKLGAVLVCPQGLTKEDPGFSWGVLEFSEYQLTRAIEDAKAEYVIDPQRVVVTGFSQGANVGFIAVMRNPALCGGFIPVAGFYDHRVAPLPEPAAERMPRVFILNGRRDEEAQNNREAAERLQRAGVEVELELYPGGHQFPPDRDAALLKAARFVMGAGTR